MTIYLTIIFALIINNASYAKEFFMNSNARGWHWYEEKKLKEEVEPQAKAPPMDATALKKALQVEVEQKLDKALWYPTEKNIIKYLMLQNQVMQRSETFAQEFQKVIYKHPELDGRIDNPTTQSALHVFHGENQKSKESKVQDLSKEYGLIYFYRGGCPYCKAFASVIKAFADKFNWTILPISLDEEILPEFPHTKKDNGIAANLNIKVVPAVIALNPKTKNQIPLAYGFISQQEMIDRVNLLAGDSK